MHFYDFRMVFSCTCVSSDTISSAINIDLFSFVDVSSILPFSAPLFLIFSLCVLLFFLFLSSSFCFSLSLSHTLPLSFSFSFHLYLYLHLSPYPSRPSTPLLPPNVEIQREMMMAEQTGTS